MCGAGSPPHAVWPSLVYVPSRAFATTRSVMPQGTSRHHAPVISPHGAARPAGYGHGMQSRTPASRPGRPRAAPRLHRDPGRDPGLWSNSAGRNSPWETRRHAGRGCCETTLYRRWAGKTNWSWTPSRELYGLVGTPRPRQPRRRHRGVVLRSRPSWPAGGQSGLMAVVAESTRDDALREASRLIVDRQMRLVLAGRARASGAANSRRSGPRRGRPDGRPHLRRGGGRGGAPHPGERETGGRDWVRSFTRVLLRPDRHSRKLRARHGSA